MVKLSDQILIANKKSVYSNSNNNTRDFKYGETYGTVVGETEFIYRIDLGLGRIISVRKKSENKTWKYWEAGVN